MRRTAPIAILVSVILFVSSAPGGNSVGAPRLSGAPAASSWAERTAGPAGSAAIVPHMAPPGPGYVADTLVLVNDTVQPGNFVATPNYPDATAFDPITGEVWGCGNAIAWNNLTSTRIQGTLSPNSSMLCVADLLDVATQRLYAAEYYYDVVTVVNTTSHAIVAEVPVGTDPNGLALDPARSLLFVGNQVSDNVTVINTTTNRVVANIALSDYPSGMAFDPAANVTLVSLSNKGYVDVISDTALSVSKHVTLPTTYAYGSQPSGVTYDSTNDTMLVGEWGPDAVAVINATNTSYVSTSAVTGAVSTLVFDNWTQEVYVSTFNTLDVLAANLSQRVSQSYGEGSFGFDPSTGRLFFAASNSAGNVWEVNTSAHTLGTAFPEAGPTPDGLTYDTLSGAVLSGDFYLPEVTAVNVTTASASEIPISQSSPFDTLYDPSLGEVLASDSGVFGPPGVRSVYGLNGTPPYAVNQTLTVGGGPLGMAMDATGGTVAIADANSNSVTLLTGLTHQTTVHVGTYPSAVAWANATGTFYVTNQYTNNVSAIRASTGKVTANINVCSSPDGIANDPLTNETFVACYQSNQVDIIDDATATVTRSVGVGAYPFFVAYDPVTGLLYVTNSGSGNVSVLDGRTGNVTRTFAVGNDPAGLAVNPANGFVYVADYSSASISVIEPCPVVSCMNLTGFVATPDPIGSGQVTNLTVSVAYAVGPVTYVYSGLPTGCLSENTSKLPCRPTAWGTFNVTVHVTDMTGTVAIRTLTLTVLIPAGPSEVLLATVPSLPLVDSPMTLAAQVVGGVAPFAYHWGGLPPGCVGPSGANLTCTPTVVGNFTVTASASDALGRTANGSSLVPVAWHAGAPALSSFTATPSIVAVNQSTVFQANASGGWGVFHYVYNGLPLSCPSENTSRLTCQPTTVGLYDVVVTVVDQEGRTATQSTSLDVTTATPAISSFTATPNPATVGSPVAFQVTVIGGSAPFVYTYAGLPGGCTGVSTASPHCTPTQAGNVTVTVTVTDQLARSVVANVQLAVEPAASGPAPQVSSFTASPDPVNVGVPTTFTTDVELGTPPYSFSYTGLPSGCVGTSAASFSCTPSEPGNFTITVHVADSAAKTASASLRLEVDPASNVTQPGGTSPSGGLGLPLTDIALLAGVIVVAAAVIAVWRRRRRPADPQPE